MIGGDRKNLGFHDTLPWLAVCARQAIDHARRRGRK